MKIYFVLLKDVKDKYVCAVCNKNIKPNQPVVKKSLIKKLEMDYSLIEIINGEKL